MARPGETAAFFFPMLRFFFPECPTTGSLGVTLGHPRTRRARCLRGWFGRSPRTMRRSLVVWDASNGGAVELGPGRVRARVRPRGPRGRADQAPRSRPLASPRRCARGGSLDARAGAAKSPRATRFSRSSRSRASRARPTRRTRRRPGHRLRVRPGRALRGASRRGRPRRGCERAGRRNRSSPPPRRRSPPVSFRDPLRGPPESRPVGRGRGAGDPRRELVGGSGGLPRPLPAPAPAHRSRGPTRVVVASIIPRSDVRVVVAGAGASIRPRRSDRDRRAFRRRDDRDRPRGDRLGRRRSQRWTPREFLAALPSTELASVWILSLAPRPILVSDFRRLDRGGASHVRARLREAAATRSDGGGDGNRPRAGDEWRDGEVSSAGGRREGVRARVDARRNGECRLGARVRRGALASVLAEIARVRNDAEGPAARVASSSPRQPGVAHSPRGETTAATAAPRGARRWALSWLVRARRRRGASGRGGGAERPKSAVLTIRAGWSEAARAPRADDSRATRKRRSERGAPSRGRRRTRRTRTRRRPSPSRSRCRRPPKAGPPPPPAASSATRT